MRTAEEADDRGIPFDQTEREGELLSSEESFGAVDGIERPEDVAVLLLGVETASIEKLTDRGLGGRGVVAES